MWTKGIRLRSAQKLQARAAQARVNVGLAPTREEQALWQAMMDIEAGDTAPHKLTPEERYGREGARKPKDGGWSHMQRYRHGVSQLLYEVAWGVVVRAIACGKEPSPANLDLVDSPALAPRNPRRRGNRTGDMPDYQDNWDNRNYDN